MALYQPSNIIPSSFAGEGFGTVDVNDSPFFSWQVNGNSAMQSFQIDIMQNDADSTLVKTISSRDGCPFYGKDNKGNPVMFTYAPSVSWLRWELENGRSYKFKITQFWKETPNSSTLQQITQQSASVFITRTKPVVTLDNFISPVNGLNYTFLASYSQAQGDAIDWCRWQFAIINADGSKTILDDTGAINTGVLSYTVDGLMTGRTYSISLTVQTQNGVQATTGWTNFSVYYEVVPNETKASVTLQPDGSVLVDTGASLGIQPTISEGAEYEFKDGSFKLGTGNVRWNIPTGVNYSSELLAKWKGRTSPFMDLFSFESLSVSDLKFSKDGRHLFVLGSVAEKTVLRRYSTEDFSFVDADLSNALGALSPSYLALSQDETLLAAGVSYFSVTEDGLEFVGKFKDAEGDDIPVALSGAFSKVNNGVSYFALGTVYPINSGKDSSILLYEISSDNTVTYKEVLEQNQTASEMKYDDSMDYLLVAYIYDATSWAALYTDFSNTWSSRTKRAIGEFENGVSHHLPFGGHVAFYKELSTTGYVIDINNVIVSSTYNDFLAGSSDSGSVCSIYKILSSGIVEDVHLYDWIPEKYNLSNSFLSVGVTEIYSAYDSYYSQYIFLGGQSTTTPPITLAFSAQIRGGSSVYINSFLYSMENMGLFHSFDYSKKNNLSAFGLYDYGGGLRAFDSSMIPSGDSAFSVSTDYGKYQMGFTRRGSVLNISLEYYPNAAASVFKSFYCKGQKAIVTINSYMVSVTWLDSNDSIILTERENAGFPAAIFGGNATVSIYSKSTCDYVWIKKGNYLDDTVETAPQFDENTTFFLTDFTDNSLIASTNLSRAEIYRMDGTQTVHLATLSGGQESFKDYGIVCYKPYTYEIVLVRVGVYEGVQEIGTICMRDQAYSLIETTQDAQDPNLYHVQNVWRFGSNVSAGSVSNNNSPTWLTNFTPYRLRQGTTRSGKSGTLQALLANPTGGRYQDTAEQMEALYGLSTTHNPLFLKDMKGNLYMVQVSSPITQTINTKSPRQEVTISVPWEEIGDCTKAVILKE